MKALSIRQPWAWLILYAGKDIENRTWSTRFRGPVLIHAGKSPDYAAIDLIGAGLHPVTGQADAAVAGRFMAAYRDNGNVIAAGGIVGRVVIDGCVEQHDSPWFQGPFGFVLRDPEPVVFAPCSGQLGFFEPDLRQAVLL